MTPLLKEGRLAGRSALVAGGSGGINLAIAQRLAAEGANIFIVSRRAEKVSAAVAAINAAGGSAWGDVADVREYDAVDACMAGAAARFGPLDIIVSGAAGNFLAPASQMSTNAFRTVVDIDLIGTFNVFRGGYARLRKPGASLIAITAPQGAQPQQFQAHACAAKAGVNMLTRCLAMEWGLEGVRVNAISPGPIADTEGMKRLAGDPAQEAALKSKLPLRRYGTTDEIASLAAFLASDDSSYMTGTIVDCDGGFILGDASEAAT